MTLLWIDIYVLRAITNLAGGLAALQAGYDWNFKMGEMEALEENDDLTGESLVGLNPNFVGIRNSSMLAKSKAFMQNAIDLYGLASPLLRDTNRSEDRLFSLSTDDYQEEEDFREDLSDLDEAIQGPIDANDDDSVDLSMLFAGKVDLPDLLPALDGDKFTILMCPIPPWWFVAQLGPTARQEMLDADLLTYAPTSLLGQKFRITEEFDGDFEQYEYFFTTEKAYYLQEFLGAWSKKLV